jgi:hypothetical protein
LPLNLLVAKLIGHEEPQHLPQIAAAEDEDEDQEEDGPSSPHGQSPRPGGSPIVNVVAATPRLPSHHLMTPNYTRIMENRWPMRLWTIC